MMKCPFCSDTEFSAESLHTHVELSHPLQFARMRDRHEELRLSDEGDFMVSAFVGMAAHSAFMGSLVGGDALGGLMDGGSPSVPDLGSSPDFSGGGGDFSGGGASGDYF
jgi:uncharacterized membrane protein YgcG